MQNIENYSKGAKYDVLCDLLQKKKVEIVYDGELPNGIIPPVSITGTVTFVGTEKFSFAPEFPKSREEEEMSLEIEKVTAFDVLWCPNHKKRLAILANLLRI